MRTFGERINGKVRVIEAVDGGTDTVLSYIGYRLQDNVENLTLTGNAALSGKGNSLANRLIGNQVREAYTEDCGERPMVIERIDTGTEVVAAEGTESAGRTRMHVALAFRCLEQPAASDG